MGFCNGSPWPVQGFVQAPTFWRSFQLCQIQPLTGCTCTKRVPFRYRFDEKPALIVRLTTSRFSLARIAKSAAAGPAKPAQISPGISSQRNPACFWPAGARGRGRAYPTPTNASKGRFRPKKGHSTRNLPKHLRPGMIWPQNAPIQ